MHFLDWVDSNTEPLAEGEGGLPDCCKLVDSPAPLPEGWGLSDYRTVKSRGDKAHTYASAPFLVNLLKHLGSAYASGQVSAYAGAHRCRAEGCLAAGHVALRCNTGQSRADMGCAGNTEAGGDRCMHSVVLDENGEPSINQDLCCLVPGKSIPHPDSTVPEHCLDGSALGSEWLDKGTQAGAAGIQGGSERLGAALWRPCDPPHPPLLHWGGPAL